MCRSDACHGFGMTIHLDGGRFGMIEIKLNRLEWEFIFAGFGFGHYFIRHGHEIMRSQPLDFAIEGDGFFRIEMPDGTIAYTRDGSFKRDSNNRMVTTDGYPLADNITFDEAVPNDGITISGDGRVSQIINNVQEQVGQITLTRFVNPAGLISRGHNLLFESDASGGPIEGNPGEEGRGTLVQSVIEMSNIQVVEEMVNMIVAQRSYESNAKAITTSDSMLEIANGLKR